MHQCRAQNVPRFQEPEPDLAANVNLLSIRDRNDPLEHGLDILQGVEGLHPRLCILSRDIQVSRFFFLDFGTISQHDP